MTNPSTEPALVKVKRKREQPKKEAEVSAAPVDFKTLAAETRARMTGEKPASLLPPVGTRVMVRPHDEEGDMGEPFQATVTAHLTPEEQAASAIVDAALEVTTLHDTEHVRADEVTPIEAEATEVVAKPDLAMVPAVAPGTIGMQFVPLHQLVRSSCNVRNHYDPAAVDEMAESLASKGQLENLTGRWNAEGQVETVAGETRRRGWMQLRDQGRADPAQPVLVYLRDLTDAEALEASATENMKRRSMTALEECEAMARMQDAGRSVEDITATFGFTDIHMNHGINFRTRSVRKDLW